MRAIVGKWQVRRLLRRTERVRRLATSVRGADGPWAFGRIRVRTAPGYRLELGDGVTLGRDMDITFAERNAALSIGDGTYFNERVEIVCASSISIGAYVGVAWGTVISDGGGPHLETEDAAVAITIGDGVWVGARSTILPGATIGDGAIIGAGAVVAGTIPPRTLAAGVPARVVRTAVEWQP